MTKPGWKTTEFAVAIILIALGVVGVLAPENSEVYKAVAFIVTALTSAGYSISRGLAKAKEVELYELQDAEEEEDYIDEEEDYIDEDEGVNG